MPHGRLRATGRTGPVLILTILVTHQTTPAWAWGHVGHRVIPKVAERHWIPRANVSVLRAAQGQAPTRWVRPSPWYRDTVNFWRNATASGSPSLMNSGNRGASRQT